MDQHLPARTAAPLDAQSSVAPARQEAPRLSRFIRDDVERILREWETFA